MHNLDTQIEAYLLGELSSEDRQIFEQGMESDPALAESVAAQRVMLARLDGLRLRNSVKTALAEQPESIVKMSAKYNFTWIIGALVLILGALWFFLPKPVLPSSPLPEPPPAKIENKATDTPVAVDKMAEVQEETATQKHIAPPKGTKNKTKYIALANTYQVQPVTGQVRVVNKPGTTYEKSTYLLAAEHYDQKRYDQCLALIKSDKEPDNAVRFLRANALFRLEQYQEAAIDFEPLFGSFGYQSEARWNAVLCALAQGELDKLKTPLSVMTSDEFPYHKMAIELSAQLFGQD